MSESVSFQRFNSRYLYLQKHSQVMAVSLNRIYNILRRNRTNNKTISETLKVDSQVYTKLNEPVSEYARIINYSRRECNEYCFVELYNIFASYMKDILKEMYLIKPKSIVSNSHKEISFIKLSEFNSIDEMVDYMIDQIFRDFESERSTPKLVRRIIGHTKINIPKPIADEAMMYLLMRHLIIHNNSKVDQDYYNKYHNNLSVMVGHTIPATYENLQNAFSSVKKYLQIIDEELIKGGFLNERNSISN